MKIVFVSSFLALLLQHILSLKPPITIASNINIEFTLQKPGEISSGNYYQVYTKYLPNDEAKSDFVVQFQRGQGYSTKIAFYKKEEDIKVDEQGVFLNPLFEFDLKAKEIVVPGTELEKNSVTSLYIVIYDLKYYYRDSFRIFSEVLKIFLEHNHCYHIPRLYSRRSFTFYTIDTASNAYMSLSSAYIGAMSPILEIRETDPTGKLVKEYTDLNQFDMIKISKSQTYFYFIFKAKEGMAIDEVFDVNFCFQLVQKRVQSIIGAMIYERLFAFDMPFYFKFDMKDYQLNEEGSVMIDFNYTTADPFGGFYCKYTQDTKTEEELIEKFPTNEEDNECAFQKDDLIDTSYHLYFKNSTTDINTTLLVLVKVKGKHSFASSPGFRVIVPAKAKVIEEADIDHSMSINFPKYYLINPNKIHDNIIASSSSDIGFSVFIGSLFTGKVPTKPKYHSKLFAINRKKDGDKEDQPLVYLKLYGGSIESINFEIYFLSQQVYFFEQEERSESLSIQINNCNNHAYYIGSFLAYTNSFLSVNQLYGKTTIRYQPNYSPTNKTIENLPNESSGLEVIGLMKVVNTVDIMRITCSIPSYFTINYLPQEKPANEFKAGDSLKTLVAPNQEILYEIQPGDASGLEARVDSDESKVVIYVNGELKSELNKGNKVYTQTLVKDEKYTLSFKSISLNETTFSLSLGSASLYPAPITQSTSTKNQLILIELDKAKEFYSVDISITSTDKSYTLCSMKGFYDKQYLPLPKSNCKSLTDLNTMTLINPYDKYVSSTNPYYIALQINQIPAADISIEIAYTEKEKALKVQPKTMTLFTSETPRFRTTKGTDEGKNLIYHSLIPCFGQKVNYQVLFNRNKLVESSNVSQGTFVLLNNLLAEIDFHFSAGKGIFSYGYITQKEYDDFKTLKVITIEVSSNKDKIKLKFTPFIKGRIVKYNLYVVKTDNKQAVIDGCALMDLQPTNSISQSNAEDQIELEVTVKESGVYQVNILALTIEGIIAQRAYEAQEVTVNIKKEDDKPKSNGWIWIIAGSVAAIALIVCISVFVVRYIKGRKEVKQELAEPFDGII